MNKPEVWFAIPSASPEKCRRVLPMWKAKGYKTAVLQNFRRGEIPADIAVWYDSYPGWAGSVNILCREIVPKSCPIIVTGGDDMLPDPTHSADELASQFLERFPDTFGVMQPHGDEFMIARMYCGSPFIGRAWFDTMYGGTGPMCADYRHNWADNELYWLAKGMGALWERPDLSHFHEHFTREGGGAPDYWKQNVQAKILDDCRLYINRSWSRFPGHEPAGGAARGRVFDSAVLAQGALHLAEMCAAQATYASAGRTTWARSMEAALQACARDGQDTVAIYGAGAHTRNVAAVLMEPPVHLACIIDDNAARWGKTMWGYPIVSRDEALRMGIKAVVLSGFGHESSMWDNCGVFLQRGIPVRRLYTPFRGELDHRVGEALRRCRASGARRIALANVDPATTGPGSWLRAVAGEIEGIVSDELAEQELDGVPVYPTQRVLAGGIDAIIDCGVGVPARDAQGALPVLNEWLYAPPGVSWLHPPVAIPA